MLGEIYAVVVACIADQAHYVQKITSADIDAGQLSADEAFINVLKRVG